MRVWVRPSGRRIAPFDDPIGETQVGNRPLSEWQDEFLTGFTRLDALQPPCLEVPDTLFTTPHVIRHFVKQAAGQNAVLVLKASHFATSSTPVQPDVHPVDEGFRFDAIRFHGEGDTEPREIVIDPDEETMEVDLPDVLGGDREIGLPRHPVMTLHHWVHILWVNQACATMTVRQIPWWLGLLKVIWAILRAGSIDKWRVLAKLNTVGKKCDIHPTAVVEGSTLGDNVTVGPYARVVFSTIGDGAKIMSGAEVEASTVGAGVTVGQRSGLRLCVVYPGAFTSQVIMQASVIGRRAFTTPGSFSIDINFDRNIRVPLDGKLHDTGTNFLGSAFGHDARVGTGIWLASGRAIPNDSLVVIDPRNCVQRVPAEAPEGPMVNVDGVLTPL